MQYLNGATCLTVAVLVAVVAAQQHPLKLSEVNRASKGFKQAITPEVSAYAEELLQQYHTPGLSVGVVQFDGDEVVNEFGFWGNKTEDGLKVSNETLFIIGSISKAFTASAVGILMDDFAHHRNKTSLPEGVHRLTWDTKVEWLLPKFWKTNDPFITHDANLRDILSHVSGLYGHDVSYGPSDTPVDLAARLKHLPPVFELRNQWSYNNQMFVLAALVIETYAKQSFTSFVTERIFEPLGMTSTSYDTVGADEAGSLSQSFAGLNGTTRRIPLWFGADVQRLLAGAGGIVSNTIDMNKWIAMLLNEGVDPTTHKRILPKSVYDAVTTAHALVQGKGMFPSISIVGYGLGWVRYSAQGHELITHGGGLPGFLSLITLFPNDGLGVISFINHDAQTLNIDITNRIAAVVLDLNPGAQLSDLTSMGPAYTMPGISTSHPFEDNQWQPEDVQLKDYPLDLEAYAGMYSHPGYGSFTLCHPSSKNARCKDVIANYMKVFPSDDVPALHASWDRVWFSHLRVDVLPVRLAMITAMTLFPDGYGRDKAPFAYYPSGSFFATFSRSGNGTIDGLVWAVGPDGAVDPHIFFSKE